MKTLTGYFYEIKNRWKEYEISTYASSMAFFLFLSFLPFLLFVTALLPYTPISAEELTDFLRKALPFGSLSWISTLVMQVYQKTPTLLSISILLVFWSFGKGMMALIKALNMLHGTKENRGYFRLRMLASIYTLAVVFMFLLTLCFGVFGKSLFRLLFEQAPNLNESLLLLEQSRETAVFIILFLFFLGIYALIPEKRLTLRSQIPGAAVASVSWAAFSYGFSVYVERFQPFTGYGSLGTIVVFLLWLYFCSCIILLGVLVNVTFHTLAS